MLEEDRLRRSHLGSLTTVHPQRGTLRWAREEYAAIDAFAELGLPLGAVRKYDFIRANSHPSTPYSVLAERVASTLV